MGVLREAVENYFYDGIEWVKAKADSLGNQLVSIFPVNRVPLSFEDTAFVVGESPATLDINNAYGENGREFSVINDGAGDFTVAISNDGSAFSSEHTVKNGEVYELKDISLDSIRITHVTNSAYRAVAL